jgi:replicative DNA helicase
MTTFLERERGRNRDRRRPSPGDGFRIPPQNLEAEQALIGSVLHAPKVLDDVLPIVRLDDLYREEHQAIWRRLVAMYERGGIVDMITLADELAMDTPEMTRAVTHWTLRLGEFMEYTPSAVNALEYAHIVRGYGTKRRLIEAADAIIADAYRNDQTADEIAEAAERGIFAVTEERIGNDVVSVGDAARLATDRMDARRTGTAGLSTGLAGLDEMLDGLKPEEVTILAARPSMGKTACVVNVLEWVTMHLRVPALFVSLEMGRADIAERFLASRSGVPSRHLRDPNRMTSDEMTRLAEAYSDLRQAPLWIDDSPTRSALAITATARRYKSRHGIGLVVIDYLQLIEPEEARDTRQEQVAKISRRLKTLARILKVPVVPLCQLNRAVEDRDKRTPRLSDLRDSGALEQDADNVLLLHRPEYYKPGDRPGEADLIVAKNRNGPTGTVALRWLREVGRFENAAEVVPAAPSPVSAF